MNRRFIAPFLAVDATRSLAGGGYSPDPRALPVAANGAGAGAITAAVPGMRPAAGALIAGHADAIGGAASRDTQFDGN
jgi:hypothetical protein